MRRGVLIVLIAFWAGLTAFAAQAQQMTVAAASSLRPTLDHLAEAYMQRSPAHEISVIYGSSGRLLTQILNGAPFDFFMSADMDFPQQLAAQGQAASEPRVYGLGRLVLWSAHRDASTLTLADLSQPSIRRIAIAQPAVAPYGQRAQQALEAAGVWQAVQDKLVFGESIAQAAQMSESGAADIGIIAQSLAMQPALAGRGYRLIDAALHQPLEQGFVITRRGADNVVARGFAEFLLSAPAQAILQRSGFDVTPKP